MNRGSRAPEGHERGNTVTGVSTVYPPNNHIGAGQNGLILSGTCIVILCNNPTCLRLGGIATSSSGSGAGWKTFFDMMSGSHCDFGIIWPTSSAVLRFFASQLWGLKTEAACAIAAMHTTSSSTNIVVFLILMNYTLNTQHYTHSTRILPHRRSLKHALCHYLWPATIHWSSNNF